MVQISLKFDTSEYGNVIYPLSPYVTPQEFLIIYPFSSQPTIVTECHPSIGEPVLFENVGDSELYTGNAPKHGPFAIKAALIRSGLVMIAGVDIFNIPLSDFTPCFFR